MVLDPDNTSSKISGPIRSEFTTRLKEASRIWPLREIQEKAVGGPFRGNVIAKSGGGGHKERTGRGAKDIGKK